MPSDLDQYWSRSSDMYWTSSRPRLDLVSTSSRLRLDFVLDSVYVRRSLRLGRVDGPFLVLRTKYDMCGTGTGCTLPGYTPPGTHPGTAPTSAPGRQRQVTPPATGGVTGLAPSPT